MFFFFFARWLSRFTESALLAPERAKPESHEHTFYRCLSTARGMEINGRQGGENEGPSLTRNCLFPLFEFSVFVVAPALSFSLDPLSLLSLTSPQKKTLNPTATSAASSTAGSSRSTP